MICVQFGSANCAGEIVIMPIEWGQDTKRAERLRCDRPASAIVCVYHGQATKQQQGECTHWVPLPTDPPSHPRRPLRHDPTWSWRGCGEQQEYTLLYAPRVPADVLRVSVAHGGGWGRGSGLSRARGSGGGGLHPPAVHHYQPPSCSPRPPSIQLTVSHFRPQVQEVITVWSPILLAAY